MDVVRGVAGTILLGYVCEREGWQRGVSDRVRERGGGEGRGGERERKREREREFNTDVLYCSAYSLQP